MSPQPQNGNRSVPERRRRIRDFAALKDPLLVAVPIVLIVLGAFWLASTFIRPAPPTRFVMSTGPEDGGYHRFAQRYRDIVARDGVDLELRPSAGSLQNLERLRDEGSGVEAALVQAGAGGARPFPELRSLGAVYQEPLWIFHRLSGAPSKLNQLQGRRLAVGAPGSGTRALAMELLQAVGIDASNSELQFLSSPDAADALVQGRIDAAFMVGSPDAPTVQRMLRTENVRLLSLSNAEAFTRRFPYLTALTLPTGVLDLAAEIPAREVHLLATPATLVVREDFHPALAYLLLHAAAQVHSHAGLFARRGEFPAARESEFALSEEAERYLQNGPPFLRRYLPFWLANLIERMVVLLVPLFAVLIPAFKMLPALLEWRVRSRVFRWYGEIQFLEEELGRAQGGMDAAAMLARLDEIEAGVTRTRVPKAYSHFIYNLRTHIDVVRNRIHRLIRQRDPEESAAAPTAAVNAREPVPPRATPSRP
jgi:TRAP transporter TAXI family solute receptor